MVLMVSFIFAVLLLVLALATITLQKTYAYVPEAELKRQARAGNGTARELYRAVAYGANLRLLLWLLIGIFAATGLVLFVRIAPLFFGVFVVSLVLWLGFAWMPSSRLSKVGALISRWCTPAIVRVLSVLNPVLSPITHAWYRRFPLFDHNGMYEKDDLLAVIKQQRNQEDNRISSEVLDIVERALQFDTKAVRDIVKSRQQIHLVSATETVGPVLLDELHATGFLDFPVYSGTKDNIVATLHLMTLDEAKQGGSVLDYADKKVAYLHEADNLADALHALYKTRQQLFIVVNNFDEFVGVVALEDILHALLGAPGRIDFDAHTDRQAVAAKHKSEPLPEPEMEILPNSPETVVE
jgi:CBS domain containing-hemolysin-like protein